MLPPTFHLMLGLSALHFLNDAMQSVLIASYPLLKSELGLNFTELGLVTLCYQLSASIFQPVVGWGFDRRPSAWSLPMGSVATLTGLLMVAFSGSWGATLFAVALVGLGSAVTHPEASRLTSLASSGHRGLAQSIFQVGGNTGSALGPLLVAAVVTPRGLWAVGCFSLFAVVALVVAAPVCRWYRGLLTQRRADQANDPAPERRMPLTKAATAATLGLITILILSKYIYMATMQNYLTFYVIDRFGLTVGGSQVVLFLFLLSTAVGTLFGGPLGDRIGRKYVIWLSILGTAPWSLALPHLSLVGVVVCAVAAGLTLSSAFPAILLYAQELLPHRIGLISGLFFGFAFGVGGVASALLGSAVDAYGLQSVFLFSSFAPLGGLVAAGLPNLGKVKKVV